jgi:hypothetical protein
MWYRDFDSINFATEAILDHCIIALIAKHERNPVSVIVGDLGISAQRD